MTTSCIGRPYYGGDDADGRAGRGTTLAFPGPCLLPDLLLRFSRAGRGQRLAPVARRPDRVDLSHDALVHLGSYRRCDPHPARQCVHRRPASRVAPQAPYSGSRRAAPRERAHHDLSASVSGGERPAQLDDDAAVPLDGDRLRARRIHVGRDRPRALLLGSGRPRREREPPRDPLAPDPADRAMRARVPSARLYGLRVLLGGPAASAVGGTARRGAKDETIVLVVWAAILAI